MPRKNNIDNRIYAKKYYEINKEHIKIRVQLRYSLLKDQILADARIRYHGRYRDTKLAKTYGITKEEARHWLAIMACEICGNTERRMTLDHNHSMSSGIRGRLCTNCNSGIGHFKDCPETLELAAKYLRDRKEKATNG